MPNIQQLLNDEIRRLARKEINIAVKDLKAQISALRKTVADQNRQIKSLEKLLSTPLATVQDKAPESTVKNAATKSLRVTAERITKWRTQLGLKQNQYAKLLDVSPLTVSHWERNLSTPRASQKQRIADLRDMGKRELIKLCAEKGIKLPAANNKRAED